MILVLLSDLFAVLLRPRLRHHAQVLILVAAQILRCLAIHKLYLNVRTLVLIIFVEHCLVVGFAPDFEEIATDLLHLTVQFYVVVVIGLYCVEIVVVIVVL